ncbi:MAG: hypothetical protein IKN29_05365 [Bacteroidales bacterium]|nr:hypothetical protein [Bacteroidales bacterium]MBR6899704.1 hypothetical protein [Bacteroidales bacterium]
MNEQEITLLLENLRRQHPKPADPRLLTAIGGYRRWGRMMRHGRTLAAILAMALITAATAVVVPEPRYAFVEGSTSATAACLQIDLILAKS